MSTTPEPLLKVSGLSVSFGKNEAVSGVDLSIYPGQTVAIVGESGSGKTTTANAVLNLLPGSGKVTAGSIVFDGKELTTLSKKQVDALRGSDIGLVPQDPMSNLNPLWRIGFQVREALTANGIAKGAEAKKRTAELLTEAGMRDAESRMNQFPHEFSGGMRQRALIAIGLSCRPKLLVADEPTSALDVTVQRQILDHLDGLTKELGTSVLLITHDLGLAAERASHLVVMYRGNVVESGPALDILRNPQHEYTKRLVASAPSLASTRLAAQSTSILTSTELNKVDSLVSVKDLTKVFDIRGSAPWKGTKLTAVDNVSFDIRRGTTTAVVGESGSGKSTVAQMVLGLLDPTKGSVNFDGRDVKSYAGKDNASFRKRVQPIFQNPYGSIDPLFSIYRVIEEPLRIHGIGSKAEREKKVRDLLDKVAMPASTMRRFPNELSGGQRQRVAIARALALDPEVVVCDEAVSALDVLVQAQILDLLNELQSELNLTYLFITHDLAVVKLIADDVVVMEQGKIVEQATADEIFASPQQKYTQRLLDAIPGAALLG